MQQKLAPVTEEMRTQAVAIGGEYVEMLKLGKTPKDRWQRGIAYDAILYALQRLAKVP